MSTVTPAISAMVTSPSLTERPSAPTPPLEASISTEPSPVEVSAKAMAPPLVAEICTAPAASIGVSPLERLVASALPTTTSVDRLTTACASSALTTSAPPTTGSWKFDGTESVAVKLVTSAADRMTASPVVPIVDPPFCTILAAGSTATSVRLVIVGVTVTKLPKPSVLSPRLGASIVALKVVLASTSTVAPESAAADSILIFAVSAAVRTPEVKSEPSPMVMLSFWLTVAYALSAPLASTAPSIVIVALASVTIDALVSSTPALGAAAAPPIEVASSSIAPPSIALCDCKVTLASAASGAPVAPMATAASVESVAFAVAVASSVTAPPVKVTPLSTVIDCALAERPDVSVRLPANSIEAPVPSMFKAEPAATELKLNASTFSVSPIPSVSSNALPAVG